MKIAAAIDIGSNSILLSIARTGDVPKLPLELLVDEAHVTGLAKGIHQGGKISEERLARSLEVLKKYRQAIDEFNVRDWKVVGTEAFRKATNGEFVRSEIERVLNHRVEIISGDREAELSFWSVQKEFPQEDAKKIVFDIGGASTELCFGNDHGIEEKVSLKVGSVLLTETFGLQKKASSVEPLRFVDNLVQTQVSWLKKVPPTLGIGVAGTMTTIVSMEKRLRAYDRYSVHGESIEIERVRFWLEEILSRDLNDRQNIPGLAFERADIIGGGLAILYALMNNFRWERAYCMDSGVRFGLLYELLGL